MLSPALDFGDVVIRPCYLLAREDDGQLVMRFKARYYRRGDDGQLVAMTDPEVASFLVERPGVTRMLLEHRAVSAELRADHAERRLREAQRRIAEFDQLPVLAVLEQLRERRLAVRVAGSAERRIAELDQPGGTA